MKNKREKMAEKLNISTKKNSNFVPDSCLLFVDWNFLFKKKKNVLSAFVFHNRLNPVFFQQVLRSNLFCFFDKHNLHTQKRTLCRQNENQITNWWNFFTEKGRFVYFLLDFFYSGLFKREKWTEEWKWNEWKMVLGRWSLIMFIGWWFRLLLWLKKGIPLDNWSDANIADNKFEVFWFRIFMEFCY